MKINTPAVMNQIWILKASDTGPAANNPIGPDKLIMLPNNVITLP